MERPQVGWGRGGRFFKPVAPRFLPFRQTRNAGPALKLAPAPAQAAVLGFRKVGSRFPASSRK